MLWIQDHSLNFVIKAIDIEAIMIRSIMARSADQNSFFCYVKHKLWASQCKTERLARVVEMVRWESDMQV